MCDEWLTLIASLGLSGKDWVEDWLIVRGDEKYTYKSLRFIHIDGRLQIIGSYQKYTAAAVWQSIHRWDCFKRARTQTHTHTQTQKCTCSHQETHIMHRSKCTHPHSHTEAHYPICSLCAHNAISVPVMGGQDWSKQLIRPTKIELISLCWNEVGSGVIFVRPLGNHWKKSIWITSVMTLSDHNNLYPWPTDTWSISNKPRIFTVACLFGYSDLW